MSSSQTQGDATAFNTASGKAVSGSGDPSASTSAPPALSFGASQVLYQGAILTLALPLPTIGTNADDIIILVGLNDDTLLGLGGQDTLSGGDGIDLIFGGNGNDVLYGGDRPDFLFGDAGDDTLIGDESDDILYADNEAGINGDGAHHNNLLLGLAGDDTLFGSLGRDSLDGGDGNDVLHLGATGDVLTGGAGADVFQINLQFVPASEERVFASDTIADFSAEQVDVLSFGLTGGILNGVAGPAPLIWRGVMNSPGGVEFGLTLPVGDLGSGFLQAWFIADEAPAIVPGGWLTIDLDSDGLLSEQDFLLRVNMPLDHAANLHLHTTAGSFGGIAGDARDNVLAALTGDSWILALAAATSFWVA